MLCWILQFEVAGDLYAVVDDHSVSHLCDDHFIAGGSVGRFDQVNGLVDRCPDHLECVSLNYFYAHRFV